MNRGPALLLALALPVCLTACTAGEYPSLARRDAERIKGTAEPADPGETSPSPPAPPSAELTTNLARLVSSARAAHGRFVAARPRAERTVAAAAGSAAGSENWSVATIALGELDSARSQTMASLSDLDALFTAERVMNYLGDTGDSLAIDAARQEVATLLADEDRVIEALAGRLGV